MADQENHFTVFIRLPFNRGDFVDPPQVSWSVAKERDLWEIISRATKDNEVDWKGLADHFKVTEQFLLQQSAWLYERQLSQVRAQMRRMGNRTSATASPVSGSAAGSVVATQSTKRPSGPASRVPSRLSTQTPTTVGGDTSAPSTPQRSRTSLPFKSTVYAGTVGQARTNSTSSKPLSRKSSRDNEQLGKTHSRRGSVQQQQQHLTRSPGELGPAESSSDEDENVAKATHRRPNPASGQRKTAMMRRSQHARQSLHSAQQLQDQQEEDEDDDPAFLPFAATKGSHPDPSAPLIDPSATLRGGFSNTATKPVLRRNHTSERVKPGTSVSTSAPKQRGLEPPIASSTSSLSSNNAPSAPPPRSQHPHTAAARGSPANLPIPLSPRQQAALAAAAGLSPRRRSANPHHTGSESSPSMGSSFSDLDDASVTQSALEEALMSNMGSTAGMTGGMGALGTRVSGISQALRSRYFDARSGAGQGESPR